MEQLVLQHLYPMRVCIKFLGKSYEMRSGAMMKQQRNVWIAWLVTVFAGCMAAIYRHSAPTTVLYLLFVIGGRLMIEKITDYLKILEKDSMSAAARLQVLYTDLTTFELQCRAGSISEDEFKSTMEVFRSRRKMLTAFGKIDETAFENAVREFGDEWFETESKAYKAIGWTKLQAETDYNN